MVGAIVFSRARLRGRFDTPSLVMLARGSVHAPKPAPDRSTATAQSATGHLASADANIAKNLDPAGDHVRGAGDARVTLVECGDVRHRRRLAACLDGRFG
jgi:hypothetical protein